MKIGVISAMDSEHRQLVERLEHKEEVKGHAYHYVKGELCGNELILTQSGIGKANAAACTAELITLFAPDCVLSTGVAGGIDATVGITDVVVSSRLVYHDVWCGEGEYGQIQGCPLYFEGNKTLLEHALLLNDKGLESRIHGGLICTGDQFIADKAELKKIKENFPAGMACDMESASIAQICYRYNTAFLSFRIISDAPGTTEDNFAMYTNFWATMADRGFRATWAFLTSLPTAL